MKITIEVMEHRWDVIAETKPTCTIFKAKVPFKHNVKEFTVEGFDRLIEKIKRIEHV